MGDCRIGKRGNLPKEQQETRDEENRQQWNLLVTWKLETDDNPNWIVMANSTNTFKRRLDIYIGRTKRLSTIFMHSYKEPEVVV